MADYKAMILSAKKEIELADHLMYVTYKLVKENKFLLAILEHINNSAQRGLQALVDYEYAYKRISICPTNFAVQIALYRDSIEKTHTMDPVFFRLFRKLLEIKKFENEAIVRFKRGDKYILASGEYSNLTVLDDPIVKKLLNCTKHFIERTEAIIASEEKRL